MKTQLKELKSDIKFWSFLRVNELDPVKILSMPNEHLIHNNIGKSNLSFESYTEYSIENVALNLEDYAQFSFII